MGNITSFFNGQQESRSVYSQPFKTDVVQIMLKFGFNESLSVLISDFVPYRITIGYTVNNGKKKWRTWRLDENASFVISEMKERARDDYFAPRSRQIAIFAEIRIDRVTLVEGEINPLIKLEELVPRNAKECVIGIKILKRSARSALRFPL